MRAAIAAAPAAPAPAGFVLVPLEPTPEMLKRFDGFEFRAPFDPKHAALREGLWRSLLNAAPAAPAQAEAKPAVEPVARVEQVKSSTQFRLIWLQRPVEGVLYAAPAAPASHPDTELLDWLDKEASVGNGLHLACLSGGLRSAIAARIARDKAASKESGNGQ
jgi:hypothetical protein